MPFKKGQSGNKNGRPSDPNVKILREAQRQILIDGLDKLRECLENLKGKDYIEFYLKLQKDVVPALASEQEVEENRQRDIRSIFELVDAKIHGKTGTTGD